MITVHIVGNESKNDNGTSGFKWFPNNFQAEKCLLELKGVFDETDQIIYNGKLLVPFSLDETEQITEFVEDFLMENNWNDAFTKHKIPKALINTIFQGENPPTIATKYDLVSICEDLEHDYKMMLEDFGDNDYDVIDYKSAIDWIKSI